MKYRRGDVVRAAYPMATGVGAGLRPCVVIQNDDDNKKIANTVVAQITTNLARAGDNSHVLIQISTHEGQQAGLIHDSVISCNNLATINEIRIQSRIGTLGPITIKEVNAALKAALELP
jgi:mRNA interferase MazF